jgi:hypothetical protein
VRYQELFFGAFVLGAAIVASDNCRHSQNMRFGRSVFQLTILHIQTDHYHQPRRRPAVHLQISK